MSKKTKTTGTIIAAVGKAAGSSAAVAVGSWFKALPSEHPFYDKIGRFIAGWAQIEKLLDDMIFHLCRSLSQAEISCLTGQLSGHRPRAGAVTALCELRGVDQLLTSEIKSLSDRLGDFSQQRNRIVHDAWYLSDTSKVAQSRSQTYQKERYGFKQITEQELDRLNADIGRYVDKVRALHSRLWNELNPK